jgi:hypothetical protein
MIRTIGLLAPVLRQQGVRIGVPIARVRSCTPPTAAWKTIVPWNRSACSVGSAPMHTRGNAWRDALYSEGSVFCFFLSPTRPICGSNAAGTIDSSLHHLSIVYVPYFPVYKSHRCISRTPYFWRKFSCKRVRPIHREIRYVRWLLVKFKFKFISELMPGGLLKCRPRAYLLS